MVSRENYELVEHIKMLYTKSEKKKPNRGRQLLNIYLPAINIPSIESFTEQKKNNFFVNESENKISKDRRKQRAREGTHNFFPAYAVDLFLEAFTS